MFDIVAPLSVVYIAIFVFIGSFVSEILLKSTLENISIK